MFTAVTIVAVALGYHVNIRRRQSEACNAMLGAGGHLMFADELTRDSMGRPWSPYYQNATITRLFGEDYFRQVVGLDLMRCTIEVSLVSKFAAWPNILVFLASSSDVNDSGIRALGAAAPRIIILDLSNTPITDAGLEHLLAFHDLQMLWLSGTRVTDEGMRDVGRIVSLQDLWLCDTDITDSGLDSLKSLRYLETLAVVNTAVTRAGVERLRKLLPGCKIDY